MLVGLVLGLCLTWCVDVSWSCAGVPLQLKKWTNNMEKQVEDTIRYRHKILMDLEVASFGAMRRISQSKKDQYNFLRQIVIDSNIFRKEHLMADYKMNKILVPEIEEQIDSYYKDCMYPQFSNVSQNFIDDHKDRIKEINELNRKANSYVNKIQPLTESIFKVMINVNLTEEQNNYNNVLTAVQDIPNAKDNNSRLEGLNYITNIIKQSPLINEIQKVRTDATQIVTYQSELLSMATDYRNVQSEKTDELIKISQDDLKDCLKNFNLVGEFSSISINASSPFKEDDYQPDIYKPSINKRPLDNLVDSYKAIEKDLQNVGGWFGLAFVKNDNALALTILAILLPVSLLLLPLGAFCAIRSSNKRATKRHYKKVRKAGLAYHSMTSSQIQC